MLGCKIIPNKIMYNIYNGQQGLQNAKLNTGPDLKLIVQNQLCQSKWAAKQQQQFRKSKLIFTSKNNTQTYIPPENLQSKYTGDVARDYCSPNTTKQISAQKVNISFVKNKLH